MFEAIPAVSSSYLQARFTNVCSCFVGSFPCQLCSLAVLAGFLDHLAARTSGIHIMQLAYA
jgi:hypothetical protein